MKTRRFFSVFAIATLAVSFIGCGEDSVTGPSTPSFSPRETAMTPSTTSPDYTSSATNEQIAEIARFFGYRVPSVQGGLDNPATLRESVIVANWRNRTLAQMTRDGIGLEDILRAQAGDEGGPQEFSNSEMFELAGHFGYATPDVENPDNPASLGEAVEVNTWRTGFENYLATEAPLDVVIACADELREGQDHPTQA